MQDISYITIGKIINTHGNRGMLKIMPMTDFPERFTWMDRVFVLKNNERIPYNIQKAFQHKNFIVIQFQEIEDMNQAETMKGSLLQIYRDEVMDLPEDSFYIFELEGCSVYTRQGDLLGEVVQVIQTGANDVYMVEKKGRKKPVLIPALKSVVYRVDIEQKQIYVDLPEGLEV